MSEGALKRTTKQIGKTFQPMLQHECYSHVCFMALSLVSRIHYSSSNSKPKLSDLMTKRFTIDAELAASKKRKRTICAACCGFVVVVVLVVVVFNEFIPHNFSKVNTIPYNSCYESTLINFSVKIPTHSLNQHRILLRT